MLRNTTKQFGFITKFLHWLIFIFLSAQFILVWRYNDLPKGTTIKIQYMLLHKSIGVTIFFLGLTFCIWKITNKTPNSLPSQPYWQNLTAKLVHYSLFASLILMPVVGYLMSCAAGRAVSFFGLFTLPNAIAVNKNLAAILKVTHEKLGTIILILVGVHVLAALYHHLILKDNVPKRMLLFTIK